MTTERNWQVTKTYFPSRRRVFGQRTRPHTFYRTFATLDEALECYRQERPKVIGYKLGYHAVSPNQFPVTETWVDSRAADATKRAKAAREARKIRDESTGFKRIRTRPAQTHVLDAREGATVKLVHMTAAQQRYMDQTLIGRTGIIETNYRNGRVAVKFDGEEKETVVNISQIEII